MTVYESVAWVSNRIAKAAERRATRQKLVTGARKSAAPLVQVLGLACLDFAAFQWIELVGYVAVGVSLLIVGEQLKGGEG